MQDDFAPVIIDAPCGLPSDSPWTLGAPAGFSVVLLVRPDEHSLTDAADALVWMHDRHLVSKQQVTVVVNHGAGTPTRRTRLAAAALAVRCHGLHHLPAHPRLGPGPLPPVDRPVPTRLELPLAQIGLNIWHTSQTTTRPSRPAARRPPAGDRVKTIPTASASRPASTSAVLSRHRRAGVGGADHSTEGRGAKAPTSPPAPATPPAPPRSAT